MLKKGEKFYKEEIKKELKDSTLSLHQICKCNDLLYGTFGYHDSEPPHSIILRKNSEIQLNKYKFGLWGIGVKEKDIKKIRGFCEKQKDSVYVLLKYTNSRKQNKTRKWSDELLDADKLKEEGGYYTTYIDENGVKHSLQSKDTKIFVKGSKRQQTVFVVEKYFFLEEPFNRKEFLEMYYGVTDNSNIKKSGECLFNQAPCYLLKKKTKGIVNTIYGNAWGIVLKLKHPYIVLCDDFVEKIK